MSAHRAGCESDWPGEVCRGFARRLAVLDRCAGLLGLIERVSEGVELADCRKHVRAGLDAEFSLECQAEPSEPSQGVAGVAAAGVDLDHEPVGAFRPRLQLHGGQGVGQRLRGVP